MKKIIWTALSVAVIVIPGCKKDGMDLRHETGSKIVFGASTEWLNEAGTRTLYSGLDEEGRQIGETSAYERIDWETGYDRIRILCEAAGNGPVGDYDLTGEMTIVRQRSRASLSPAGGKNGLQWGSESEDHFFYALFPAAGMTSKLGNTVASADAVIEVASGNKASVSGVIPASQVLTEDEGVYKPDMNYAYMYAATKVAAGETGAVPLAFCPLVTAFEFTLLSPADDPVTSRLTAVKLRSQSTPLTGPFSAVLDVDAPPVVTVGSNPGFEITVSLPGGGVLLDASIPLKVTMLALPVEQSNLTLELLFANGIKRTLELKKNNNSQWISVSACRKLYVQNVGVPGSMYSFDVTGPSGSIVAEGGSVTYSVKSCRNASGTNMSVSWSALFSTDGGLTWSTAKPSWLTEFTSSADGSLAATGYVASASINDEVSAKTWEGETVEKGTESAPVDLSLQDIYGTPIPLTTANCYVVNGPGWFKFPCVYGNALKNGSVNTIAYSNSNDADPGFILNEFVRHDDQPIVAPWIKDNGISITSAEMLWTDSEGLIDVVTVGDDYVTFHVSASRIWEGNAVIAVYSGSTIVWSWHIWVTEGRNLSTTTVYSHPTVNHSVVDPVEVMDTNLGWTNAGITAHERSVLVRLTQAESGKTAEFSVGQLPMVGYGSNPYWQWGRKDPMLSFTETYEESEQYGSTPFAVADHDADGAATIGRSIRYPHHFYVGVNGAGGNRSWSDQIYYNLWNANGAFQKDVAVVKTVYDPCPIGFKVPNRNAFTGFAQNGIGTAANVIGVWNFGWRFQAYPGDGHGIFFPSTSLREIESGLVRTRIKNGYYWTAGFDYIKNSTVDKTPTYLELGELELEDHVYGVRPIYLHGGMAYGFSIRPIKE